jgi:AraC-like DNA-binding protein
VFDGLDCVYQDIDRTRINSLFRELLQSWTSKHTGYSVRCRSRIMEILYILIVHSLERKTLHLRMIETLIGLMADDERKFYTIGELSDKAGVSPSYLCLIFKQTTGMTAIQYQNRIKIGKARDLLLSGDCNVSMAAERLGFNDIYYFSRLFKKVTGMTQHVEMNLLRTRSFLYIVIPTFDKIVIQSRFLTAAFRPRFNTVNRFRYSPGGHPT